MSVTPKEITIDLEDGGRVSGILLRPEGARLLYVFAHGAGAGMRHEFMEATAYRLARGGAATLRYQFPYREIGRKRPDKAQVLERTARAAVARARELAGDLPLFAGGKSMGGRMTSQSQAAEPMPGLRGLAFFGFPLHAPGKQGTRRAEHLEAIEVPMLFLQGTRDALADLDLMRQVCRGLGSRATLHVVEGADHSFKVLKRSGRTAEEVREELAETLLGWAEGRPPP